MTDALESVAVELNKSRKRQAVNTACVLRAIDELTAHFKAASDALELSARDDVSEGVSLAASSRAAPATPDVADTLGELKRRCDEMKPLGIVAAEHKNYHACVSKLCKAADKNIGADVERIRRRITLDEGRLNELIVRHLYRRGAFKTARRFSEHPTLRSGGSSSGGGGGSGGGGSGGFGGFGGGGGSSSGGSGGGGDSLGGAASLADACRPLVELHEVVSAIQRRDLDAAERWAAARRDELAEIGSTLELQLARLHFLSILQMSGPDQRRQAVVFAQARFPELAENHMSEIQQLMGCLLWAGRLERSPYAALLSEELWATACRAMAADGCRLAGLPRESGLAVAFRAGVMAVPTLIKMAAVVQSSNKDWDTMTELPVEIPLDKSMLFHSIFSCPVSREQSTPDNPPVLLKCGHVVCRSTMGRIAKHGPGSKFKCPTCPREQTEADIRVLHL